MPTAAEAAEILRAIGEILDLEGERFKPEAYRRAARSIETLTEGLAEVAARGELSSIPGVGEAIEEKLKEFLATGKIGYYEKIRAEVPEGVLRLMRLGGVGPRTARRFWKELGVTGPEALARAIDDHRLDAMPGFGTKRIDRLRASLGRVPALGSGRLPISDAYRIAEELRAAIARAPGALRVEAAGSLRRRRETVGDLDLLVSSSSSSPIFERVARLPEVDGVVLQGATKQTIRLRSGLQVDVRVVAPEEFGAALQYFTGSKDHNVHLRTLARERGLKISEYGAFRGEERVAGASEEDVYASVGLSWIPPELREDRGEIEAAAKGPLPALVEATGLKGELHLHLPAEATPADVDRGVEEAGRRGFEFVGFVVAGTEATGAPLSVPAATLSRIDRRAEDGRAAVRVLRAWEGRTADLARAPPRLDYALLRAEGAPPPRIVAGPGPAPLLAVHVEAGAPWAKWAAQHRLGIEVGPPPGRVDSDGAREALAAGARLGVPTGLGLPGGDPLFPVALGFARRAGAAPGEVLNAAPYETIRPRPGSTATPSARGRPRAATTRPSARARGGRAAPPRAARR